MSSPFSTIQASVLVVLWLGIAPLAGAQERFEVLTIQSLPALSNLEIVTIRDRVLNTCYTMFVTDPKHGTESHRAYAIDLQQAIAARDRRLAELRTDFEKSVVTLVAGMPSPNPVTLQWEADKAQFEFMLSALTQTMEAAITRLEMSISASRSTVVHAGSCSE